MGDILSKGVTANVCIDTIHASPETVWLTIADLESVPNYFSFVKSLTTVDERSQHHSVKEKNGQHHKKTVTTDNNGVQVVKDKILMSEGLAWDEIRIYDGHEARLHKRVTSIETVLETFDNVQHEQKRIRIHVSFPSHSKRFYNACNTSTLIIDSVIPSGSITNSHDDGNSCIYPDHCSLIGTMAFLSPSFWYQLHLFLFAHCCVLKKIHQIYQMELNEIAIEAERRQKIINQSIETSVLAPAVSK